MSVNLGRDNNTDFQIGEWVSFDHEGERLTGQVVRVYASRENYHVDVNGTRFAVNVLEDAPRRI